VQVLVKGGERIAFKDYPTAENAQILRTVVWASDLKSDAPARVDSAGIAPEAQGQVRYQSLVIPDESAARLSGMTGGYMIEITA
jgi:hypothetical protein